MYRRVRLLTLLQIGSMNPDVVDLRAKGTLECPLLRGSRVIDRFARVRSNLRYWTRNRGHNPPRDGGLNCHDDLSR